MLFFKTKKDKNLIVNRVLYLNFYDVCINKQSHSFLLSLLLSKPVYDMIMLLIKVEASGVLTERYKVSLIDDLVSLIAFIVYVGG